MIGGPELIFGAVLAIIAVYIIIQIMQFFVGLAIKAGLVFLTISVIWFLLKHVVGLEFLPHIPDVLPF